jgi:hypothetical protein
VNGYEWKPGWRPSGISAATAGEEIARIRAKHGTVTAEVVLAEARDLSSPLHSVVFHVPARRAAEAYYLERVRKVIQAIIVFTPGREESFVRAFQFVRAVEGDDPDYVSVEVAAADPYMREQIHDGMRRKIRALQRELAAWDEYAALVAAMDEVLTA